MLAQLQPGRGHRRRGAGARARGAARHRSGGGVLAALGARRARRRPLVVLQTAPAGPAAGPERAHHGGRGAGSHCRQPERGLPARRHGGVRLQAVDGQRRRLRPRRPGPGIDAAAGVVGGHRPLAPGGRDDPGRRRAMPTTCCCRGPSCRRPERADGLAAAGADGFAVRRGDPVADRAAAVPRPHPDGHRRDRAPDDAAGDRAQLCRRADGHEAARRDHQRRCARSPRPATSPARSPYQPGSWEDEDARLLASTFNTLTDSIARFEKEAAQRERLSSLGRLSSVVAHEIRNPLMIIKSAARTLRQPDAGADAREEAVQDIDQEVVRLNRIVTEVLDYAKPLTFTWQDADAERDLQRSGAGRGGRRRRRRRSGPCSRRRCPPIRTDPERLRTVLVNVLQNAAQAVRAARGAAEHARRRRQRGRSRCGRRPARAAA